MRLAATGDLQPLGIVPVALGVDDETVLLAVLLRLVVLQAVLDELVAPVARARVVHRALVLRGLALVGLVAWIVRRARAELRAVAGVVVLVADLRLAGLVGLGAVLPLGVRLRALLLAARVVAVLGLAHPSSGCVLL